MQVGDVRQNVRLRESDRICRRRLKPNGCDGMPVKVDGVKVQSSFVRGKFNIVELQKGDKAANGHDMGSGLGGLRQWHYEYTCEHGQHLPICCS